MKRYQIVRNQDGTVSATVHRAGPADGSAVFIPPSPLAPRREPAGFDYGKAGGGSEQLALALLADVFGNNSFALKWHGMFCGAVIMKVNSREWWIDELSIMRIIIVMMSAQITLYDSKSRGAETSFEIKNVGTDADGKEAPERTAANFRKGDRS